ncbi:MAG: GDP-mannose 4,6-dehydratase [Elusimicrobia bacterium]|nr:GDP-mannose 4,6-dehydratase [Candidatus Liberimonas magnetica]
MKKAIITGIRGQDGAYLAKLLLDKGYEVYGVDRRSGDSGRVRLREIGVDKLIKHIYMDLLELTNIMTVIRDVKPDEVYNLAAQSFVKASFDQPLLTADIDAMGVLRLLEALRYYKPDAKFYQASTSEMFGLVQAVPQNEKTPFYPRSPYSVSKLFAHWMTVNYRESYNMFACSGILFNHESPFRGLEFITKKITDSVARIKFGLQDKIIVGDISSKRDWGYAKEYVEAMWLMLQQDKPDDYVIATNETHSVKEFIDVAFKHIGIELKWEGEGVNEEARDKKSGKEYVSISPEYYRPAEVSMLIGDYSKAKKKLGWEPKTKFVELVKIMMDYDLRKIEKELKEGLK